MRARALVARLRETYDRTGEPDWSLLGPDFELHDHELLDSSVHRGIAGWKQWVSDWEQAFESYSLDRLDEVEIDEQRVLTTHRLRARGRASGVELERTDAQLWTFRDGRLVRMDYYPDYERHPDRPLPEADGS
jgi:ketosteroid isomerase-like protein